MVQKKKKTFEEAVAGAVKMSEAYVRKGAYSFYPDPEIVDVIQRGLAKNEVAHGYRYCPWMMLTGDPVEDRKKICPCDRHHEDIERDGFCIWMFFVSEEFLRKHADGEEVQSTLGSVHKVGETLFPDDQAHKAAARDRVRGKQQKENP